MATTRSAAPTAGNCRTPNCSDPTPGDALDLESPVLKDLRLTNDLRGMLESLGNHQYLAPS
eukprot:767602-Alexandrium_andersonii.AAC.1